MKVTKLHCQRRHFKKRFQERFNTQLNRQDLRNIINLIQSNQAKFIERESCRITIFEVSYLNHIFKAVYDRTRANLVTAIPLD